MTTRLPAPRKADPSSRVANSANVRRARELVAIGERSLAEQMLRHQAKIGSPQDQGELIAVARGLDLGGAQFWLAHNGQPGVRVEAADRYPAPRWTPDRGWRIDPALAYGHVIQESNFRADAVSPAGAVGLMQVRPGTAGDTARARGEYIGVAGLKRPETNLDHGQAFIELIRGSGATRGQLPKVIAAYNAGPVPVAALELCQRPRRSLAVDGEHSLLGNALLRARGASQHVGLPGAGRGRAADVARGRPSIAGRRFRLRRRGWRADAIGNLRVAFLV